MTRSSDITEAGRLGRKQRLANCQYILVDGTKATPTDLELCAQLKAAVKGDGTEIDRLLGDKAVNEMFCRGVFSIGRPLG